MKKKFGFSRGRGGARSGRKPFDKRRERSPGGTDRKPQGLWDQAARWYDALVGEEGSYYQKEIVMPRTFELLDVGRESSVLDLACGQGVFSRYLLERGIKVSGLDASAELLRFAESRSPGRIRYVHGDASDTQALPGESFDAVVCILAMQNIEKAEPVFHNIARWLGERGSFVMVLTHPCFRIPRQSHWGWDAEKKMEYRRVERYATEMAIPILTPPFAEAGSFTLTYHRPLQSYFRALSSAGLAVDALEEWVSEKVSQPGARSRAENRARREFPLFLALRARPAPRR